MKPATKKNIMVIPSQREYDRVMQMAYQMQRVAAYCRVSTLLEQQETSYEAQVSYYTEKIKNNPNWKLAGIYADSGKSATTTKKRDDFNTMIEDCMAGKIDLIITKSVSRFARNTVDALQNIRKLKEKGIAIYFEKEGVNTLESTGELLITILSSQAQEESRNLSENTRWGLVRRFENGIISVNHQKFLGYTKDEHGELVIVPEEAQLVRRIFRLFLEGNSALQIGRLLEADGIKTVTGKDKWQASVIDQMLRNEKYMGDALLQKTYTLDFLTKKRVFNKGIVPQYYIEDNHQAILPREIFYRVQEEKARRASIHKRSTTKKSQTAKSKYSSKYALSEIMICSECGQPYRRQVWSKYGQKSGVWRCDNRLKNGTKTCHHSPTLKEQPLHEALMTAINHVVESPEEFVNAFRENVLQVISNCGVQEMSPAYDEEITASQIQLLTLIEDNANQTMDSQDFDQAYQAIAEKIRTLKLQKLKLIQQPALDESLKQRVEGVDACLGQTTWAVRDYDEELVRRLLQSVKVISEDKLEIQFKSGIVIEQRVNCFD